MERKITFEILIEELEKKWMEEDKEYIIDGINLFEILKEVYGFIYYEKKWPHDKDNIYYPTSKQALYNLVEQLFKRD